MTDHLHQSRVYMTEARRTPHESWKRQLVTWARDRMHRHINQRRAMRTGQLELFA